MSEGFRYENSSNTGFRYDGQSPVAVPEASGSLAEVGPLATEGVQTDIPTHLLPIELTEQGGAQ